MATLSQIRGLLLEEVLLYLLEFSGFKTVLAADGDDTLHRGPAGIEVKGRGCLHQIDAIADFVVATPFSNPHRLLIEAKCYSETSPIGVEYVRNALGVLTDVSEYWVPLPGSNGKRYHYQYAIFSASGFTSTAEKYAFAHDIYLFPLNKSAFFQPILQNIRSLEPRAFNSDNARSIDISLSNFRASFRELLRENMALFQNDVNRELLKTLADTCRRLKGVMLGMVSRQFPIIMTPSPEFNLNRMKSQYEVEMHGFYNNQRGWVLSDRDVEILSFDIPTQIFHLYAQHGALKTTTALDMKAEFFTEIQSVVIKNRVPKIVTFRLNREWLDQLIDQANEINRQREQNQENQMVQEPGE